MPAVMITARNASPVDPPENTVPPVIAGTDTSGSTLTVTSDGTWTGTPTITYQWQRDGVDIPGETGSAYLTVIGDVDASIRCMVTGSNAGGSNSAPSNAIIIVVNPCLGVTDCSPGLCETTSLGYSLDGYSLGSETDTSESHDDVQPCFTCRIVITDDEWATIGLLSAPNRTMTVSYTFTGCDGNPVREGSQDFTITGAGNTDLTMNFSGDGTANVRDVAFNWAIPGTITQCFAVEPATRFARALYANLDGEGTPCT